MRTLSCTQMRYFNSEALYEISYNSAYNALLHVTQFFFRFKYIRKYLQNCVWLVYLFPFQKRFAKTGEFRPSKAIPCLKWTHVRKNERDIITLRNVNIYLIVCRCTISVGRPNLHDRYTGRFVFQNAAFFYNQKNRYIVIYVQYFNFNLLFSGKVIFVFCTNGKRILGVGLVIEMLRELYISDILSWLQSKTLKRVFYTMRLFPRSQKKFESGFCHRFYTWRDRLCSSVRYLHSRVQKPNCYRQQRSRRPRAVR